MLRNLARAGRALGLAATLLAGPALAQNPTAPVIATNVPASDVPARMWAATARFVYADDPALQSIRPQLLATVDSTSLKAFGRGLEKAVSIENGAAPEQEHVLTFQGKYKTLAADAANADPAALAASIRRELGKKPERMPGGQPTPAFASLLARLQALANPPAPATAAPVEAAAPTEAPVPAATATLTPTPTSPLLQWGPWGLSALSLLLAALAWMRSGRHQSESRQHSHSHAHSSAPPTLSEQDVRSLVRREVEKALAERPAAPATSPSPEPEPVSVAAPVAAVPLAAAAPAVQKLYANQQPIDGVFQRNSLAGAPASYTMYELTVDERTPTQAQFAVTGNSAGHAGFIGSHQSLLGGACTYPFPQGNVSRIVTDVPGTAQRTAAGDWQISSKAQIRFE